MVTIRPMKIKSIVLTLALVFTPLTPVRSEAAITWSTKSKKDSVFDGATYNSKYDLDYVSVAIFDNDADQISFYMEFSQIPTLDIFDDGRDSWGFIGLDYDLDGTRDIRLVASKLRLRGDLVGVDGTVEDLKSKRILNCDLGVFTNVSEGKSWVGFEVSRKCISLPGQFDVFAYAEFDPKNSRESFDYAPYPFHRVTLPGSGITPAPTTKTNPISGSTYPLPSTILNSSRESSNYTTAPINLSVLSDSLLPSVVTVKCNSGTGTGWSSDVALPQVIRDLGYQTLITSNHHVIEDCLSTKNIVLTLSNGTNIPGLIISWDETNDVAGIATKTLIPPLQWIGTSPKQGWWVGVLGSPLGKSNVLTTGIISSVNMNTRKFTLTAAINPGNSGGPVFDNTGRVIGLATSKAVLSDGQLAEGFGNAHGVSMLCNTVIACTTEPDPWNSKPKTPAGPTAEELARLAAANAAAQAESEAKAKAAIEEKTRQDYKNQCIKFNGDLEIALFNTRTASLTYSSAATLFNGLIQNAPKVIDCDNLNLLTFESELQTKRKLLTTFEIAATSAIATAQENSKKKSITCVKGKKTKKVTAVNPKCPAGYKRK